MRTGRYWKTVSAATVAVLLATGAVSLALAQGSGSRSGSSNRGEEKAKKIEVKAELNAEALKALQGARVPMILFDARGPSKEWISGAVPLLHDASDKTIRQAMTNRNRLVVTYCGGPECPMSQMLADRLATMGYENVIRFTGGLQAWEDAGYAVKKEIRRFRQPWRRFGIALIILAGNG